MILRNFLLLLCTPLLCSPLLAQSYHVSGNIQLGGTGGWDYLSADASHRRLYVSHGTEVDVIDLDSGKPVGKITDLKGVHGIAVADGMNTGFISDGRSNEVVAFDLDTLAVKQKIPAGTNPDGIVFDPASKRVFAFNGRSQNATVIDAANLRVAGTIALGGKPEFPVADGQGNVYDNIEDKSEIVQIDSKTLEVKAHWPVAPCESPSGLAMDTENRRLFAVCDGGKMAVVDADSGKVVATPAIGDGPDAAAFDPGKRLAFSSNGDGTLTVVQEVSKDSYKVLENVPTVKGARTMTLDSKTHKIYLSSASYGPAPAASASNPRQRPSILPGSFKILIVSPK